MNILMTAVVAMVAALGVGFALFWGYWVVRISVNETRKATGRFRRIVDVEEQAKPTG